MKLFGFTISRKHNEEYLLASTRLDIPRFFPIESLEINFGVGKAFLNKMFSCVPELNAVITRDADMFSKMKLEIVSKSDYSRVNNTLPLAKVLRNPNWYQSQKEWINQSRIYHLVYGNEFQRFKYGTSIKSTSQIDTLNPFFITVKDNEKPLFATSQDDMVNAYVYQYKGVNYFFTDKEIMHLTETNVKNSGAELMGVSKIEALKDVLENIAYTYETRKYFLKNRGAVGILSPSGTDAAGSINFQEKDRDMLQKEYEKYGTLKGQYHMIISNKSAQYTDLLPDLNKLKLMEEMEIDFQRICDAFGIDRDLFSNTKGATFENKKQAEKQTYENTILPAAQEWIEGLNNKLQTENESWTIIGTYDHLNVFNENLKDRGQAIVLTTNGLSKALLDGAINIQQYQNELAKLGIK